jgi:hypothetical protein
VQLVHVPARHAGSQPYLAGLALAIVAAVSERDGDAEGGAAARAEAARAFPEHPLHTAARPVPPIFEESPPGETDAR